MKYTYIGEGRILPGLPACDLDDTDLTPEQQELLTAGINSGMYVLREKSHKIKESKNANHEAESDSNPAQ